MTEVHHIFVFFLAFEYFHVLLSGGILVFDMHPWYVKIIRPFLSIEGNPVCDELPCTVRMH